MLGKLFEATKKDEFNFGNNDHRIMLCNSRLLLALRVKFSYGNNEYYKEYLKIAKICNNNNIIPSNLGREYTASINDRQFYNMLLPMFLEH